MPAKIITIGTASPKFATNQLDILDFMEQAYADKTEFRKLRVLARQSGIEKRYSVLPDFGLNLNPTFFKHQHSQPHVEDRMDQYKDNALLLALESIKTTLEPSGTAIEEITHLITVTCTGLHAPGLSAEVIRALGLRDDISHTAVNFMGCNAAFYAMKIADLIINSNEDAKVLIIAVELCTLHFQPKGNTDNLLSNTLFSDGAASVLLMSDKTSFPGLIIDGFYSLLLHEGWDLMGWDINPLSFEMILNSRVPAFIGKEVNRIFNRSAAHYSISSDDISHWAIHPGGKKILDEISLNLNLDKELLKNSYEVLRDYGNMSSPTILFVLKRFLESPGSPGEKLFSMGFGPGLSIETSLLSYG
ncbi:MAG: type III polyketide synthase [Bacteroidetes bacterium]|nr:type III polyketide synthase [Bacteroidota bacterium]